MLNLPKKIVAVFFKYAIHATSIAKQSPYFKVEWKRIQEKIYLKSNNSE